MFTSGPCCDVNLLGQNIHSVKKNTEAVLDANKECSLAVNAEKTKCMYMFCNQTKHKLL
jgi:hypothetical protein